MKSTGLWRKAFKAVDIIVSLCPAQLSEDVADVPRRKAHETFVLVCEKRLVGRLLQSFSASKLAAEPRLSSADSCHVGS